MTAAGPLQRRLIARAAASLIGACCTAALAQPVSATTETLVNDRPEAWALRYLGSTTLLTAFGDAPSAAPWQWTLAADLGHVPTLSASQQRVGFNGTKPEDLNKSPVFGRLRVGVALPLGLAAELAYTPPVEIGGAKPRNLIAASIGGRWWSQGPWSVGSRLFGQTGSVRGDFTCAADLANVTDRAINPYGCQAPSNDRVDLRYVGADLTLAWRTGQWQWHAGGGAVKTDFSVEVDALTDGVRDRSRLYSKGKLGYVSAGGRYQLAPQWSVASELLFVPLDVRRAPAYARESDGLTSLRLQVRYEMR
jgi:hypothetical protein